VRTAGPTKPPSKGDIPVATGTTLTPYRLGDTSARWGYGGGLADESISVRGHFSQCTPTEIPTCRMKMSPSEGRSSYGGDWGGGVTSLSSLSSCSSSSFPPKDSGSEGVSSPLPPHLCCRSGKALVPSPLPLCLQPFAVDIVGVPSHHILRSGDPLRGTVSVP
jgi:hypothetical protein